MPAKPDKGSPEEVAYRAYLRAVKEYWSNLDIEALDLKGKVPTPYPMIPYPCVHCYPCIYNFPFAHCSHAPVEPPPPPKG
jgi:hypothetical protein